MSIGSARHDVEHVRAAAEIDRVEPRPLRRGHRHGVVAAAAGERLDAGDRAGGEVDRGRSVSTIVSRCRVPALDELACGEIAIGEVDRVVACRRRSIDSAPAPPVIVSSLLPPVIVSAYAPPVSLKASVWAPRIIVTPAVAPAAEIFSTPWTLSYAIDSARRTLVPPAC